MCPTVFRMTLSIGDNIVQCTADSSQYTLYRLNYVQCIEYTLLSTLYRVHCTEYTVQCTLYSVHSIVYTVQCALYSVHSIVTILLP